MNRDEFVERHQATWRETEEILDRLESKHSVEHELATLPELYRRCCHHLALARQRHYESALEQRLNRIALRGYHQLYRRRRFDPATVVRFLVSDFPRLVRANAGYFWLATALFYGSGLAMGLLILDDPDSVHTLLSPEQTQSMEDMYLSRDTDERGAQSDFAMFGFYVFNNIGIAFRTFAGGLLAGLGTLFFLIFNGLFLGAVFAHLTHVGAAPNLFTFVVAHGAFELTALVIAGVAGLRLGEAVVAPGRRTRAEALRATAPICLQLILGVAALLLLAAFVEAFWSSTAWVTPTGKLTVGAIAWISTAAYLTLGGRVRGS